MMCVRRQVFSFPLALESTTSWRMDLGARAAPWTPGQNGSVEYAVCHQLWRCKCPVGITSVMTAGKSKYEINEIAIRAASEF